MKPYIFDKECHLNAAWLPLETKPTSFPCSVSGRPGHCLSLAQLSIFSLFLKGETKPAAKPGWFCWFLSFRSPEQCWRRMAGNPAGRRGETPGGAGGTVCHQGPPMGLHQLMAQSSLQLPCGQGARRELLRFILFPQFTWFEYRNTISKHFKDFFCLRCPRGVPSPALPCQR